MGKSLPWGKRRNEKRRRHQREQRQRKDGVSEARQQWGCGTSYRQGLTAPNVLHNKSRRKVSKCDSKKVTGDLKEEVSRVWRWQSDCKELKQE